jgi:hypothetical protein
VVEVVDGTVVEVLELVVEVLDVVEDVLVVEVEVVEVEVVVDVEVELVDVVEEVEEEVDVLVGVGPRWRLGFANSSKMALHRAVPAAGGPQTCTATPPGAGRWSTPEGCAAAPFAGDAPAAAAHATTAPATVTVSNRTAGHLSSRATTVPPHPGRGPLLSPPVYRHRRLAL